jgi:hypothetical protein
LAPAAGLGAVGAGQNVGRAAAAAGELEAPIGLARGVVARRRRQRRRLRRRFLFAAEDALRSAGEQRRHQELECFHE